MVPKQGIFTKTPRLNSPRNNKVLAIQNPKNNDEKDENDGCHLSKTMAYRKRDFHKLDGSTPRQSARVRVLGERGSADPSIRPKVP